MSQKKKTSSISGQKNGIKNSSISEQKKNTKTSSISRKKTSKLPPSNISGEKIHTKERPGYWSCINDTGSLGIAFVNSFCNEFRMLYNIENTKTCSIFGVKSYANQRLWRIHDTDIIYIILLYDIYTLHLNPRICYQNILFLLEQTEIPVG